MCFLEIPDFHCVGMYVCDLCCVGGGNQSIDFDMFCIDVVDACVCVCVCVCVWASLSLICDWLCIEFDYFVCVWVRLSMILMMFGVCVLASFSIISKWLCIDFDNSWCVYV